MLPLSAVLHMLHTTELFLPPVKVDRCRFFMTVSTAGSLPWSYCWIPWFLTTLLQQFSYMQNRLIFKKQCFLSIVPCGNRIKFTSVRRYLLVSNLCLCCKYWLLWKSVFLYLYPVNMAKRSLNLPR